VSSANAAFYEEKIESKRGTTGRKM